MQRLFFNRNVRNKIVDLNTLSQLFDKGEDATGRKLESIGGSYAPFTIQDKIGKGLPTDRVTLSDTFTFYDSFQVFADLDSFSILYDPIKGGEDLRTRWGDNLAGLSNESISELQDYTLPLFKAQLLTFVFS